MAETRIVLGLDIGIASVGWGLVKLTEEEFIEERTKGESRKRFKIVDGEILATGVRGFQAPHNKDKKSLAKIRGEARRGRLTTRRKARRLKRLIRLCKEFGLTGSEFSREEILKPKKGDKEQKWDIWWVRKEALDRKLTDTELFRVLYHIAKHRGFYFHTKAEEMQKEESGTEAGKVKAGLSRIEKQLKESDYKTIGQMYWEEYRQTNPQKNRKHNTKDKYENSIPRELLKEEIETIFKEQQRLGNDLATDELLLRYIDDVLMFEEGINENKLRNMMGDCEFTDQPCAPKESYSSERFTLLNRLNSLEITDTKTRKKTGLNESQRGKIIQLAYKNAKVNFAQIRKELGLEKCPEIRFNLCSYREKNPEYDKKLACNVVKGKPVFDEKHAVKAVDIETGESLVLDKEIKTVFNSKKIWPKCKNLSVYYSDIRKRVDAEVLKKFGREVTWRFDISGYTKSAEEFGGGEKGQAKYINQFEKDDVFAELKGYHKIRKAVSGECGEKKWNGIKDDGKTHDLIAESLTYYKSDETRNRFLNENGIEDAELIEAILTLKMNKLATYSKEVLDNLNEVMEKEGLFFNEAKERFSYGQVKEKKQAILRPYEGFYEKNPVVARVVSQTRKVINAIVRKYGREYLIDQINIEVANELASSKKMKGKIAAGQQRYKDAKEAAEERCREFNIDPEEGQNLLRFRLSEEQGRRCPYTGRFITYYPTGSDKEISINDCEIDHIIPMSRSFNDSLNNKVLCAPEANQNKRDRIPFEWHEDMYGKDSEQWRNFERTIKKLYSMPYTKRVNLCRKSWTDEDKDKFISRNINDTRYATRHIADYLRKYFDFSKSGRVDIKDASRVQLRSGGVTAFMRHIWGLNKNRDESNLHHALDALVVACSTYGHVYLVSNIAKNIERKGKNWYKHFGQERFKSLRPWDSIREDINEAVSSVFVSRMPRRTVTGSGHKENPKSLKDKPQKRVVRVNKGFAEMGVMVRADFYTDEKGKNYAVPIYAVDMAANRPLPKKFIQNGPYEQWETVENKGLKFKFSLFKDDLISVNDEKYYIKHILSDGRIAVRKIDDSPFNDGEKDRISFKSADLRKYSVDLLGNYKEVKQEKRQGNLYEKRANRKEKA